MPAAAPPSCPLCIRQQARGPLRQRQHGRALAVPRRSDGAAAQRGRAVAESESAASGGFVPKRKRAARRRARMESAPPQARPRYAGRAELRRAATRVGRASESLIRVTHPSHASESCIRVMHPSHASDFGARSSTPSRAVSGSRGVLQACRCKAAPRRASGGPQDLRVSHGPESAASGGPSPIKAHPANTSRPRISRAATCPSGHASHADRRPGRPASARDWERFRSARLRAQSPSCREPLKAQRRAGQRCCRSSIRTAAATFPPPSTHRQRQHGRALGAPRRSDGAAAQRGRAVAESESAASGGFVPKRKRAARRRARMES